MARQPSGSQSEGVVAIRHPRGLDSLQDGGWLQSAQQGVAAQYPSALQATLSFRADTYRKLRVTDAPPPQDGWLQRAAEDALGRLYGWQGLTQSFRMGPPLTIIGSRSYHSGLTQGWTITALPQAPFTTDQFPATVIRDVRPPKRNQDVRITTLNDGYITANLVAPSFDAVWMVAVDQLANSIRQTYVQNLALSPGLGKQGADGGRLPVEPPIDPATFPWTIDSQFMAPGKVWPRLTDQKTSFAILDVAKAQAAAFAQTLSFATIRRDNYIDNRWYDTYLDTENWVAGVAITTFDPIRMSSNMVVSDVRMWDRKWWTSDPTQLSWLIPNVLYTEMLYASQQAQSQSFRAAQVNYNRQFQQTYIEDGWLFTGTPAFDPINLQWVIPADRTALRQNIQNRLQRQYDFDNAWNVFRPEVIDWLNKDVTYTRSYHRDDRQRMYDPDNAWRHFDPALIDWTNHDILPNLRSFYRDYNRELSDVNLTGWLTQNVPPVDPTTYIAILELVNSFMARGLIRDVRQLTEMVQISWLFTPLGLVDNPPEPEPVDLDPHFKRPPTITPYWLVYPRRSRHRRYH